MRIAQINDVPARSTGTIMQQISRHALIQGVECYSFSACVSDQPTNMPGHEYIGSLKTRLRHQFLAEWTGLNGFFSIYATWKMLKKFDELDIDLIHLHNIHNYCVNFPLLFRYIRRRHIPVVWTMHCTWPYTAKCTHHVMADCDKWKTGCHHCPQRKVWPVSHVDTTRFMWRWKKRQTERIEDMTIVAASEWIANLVKQSFLGKHRIRRINHGINTYLFQPTPSDFRTQYNCQDKIVLLGVADRWRSGKGLSVMIELADRLGEGYQIVVAGTEENDPRIPDNVIAIPYTTNRKKLAELYTAADLFIQPTRAELFGLVGVEALACGTPMITFQTGGSAEIVDETCGAVVPCGDIDALIQAIQDEVTHRRFTKENCLRRAQDFSLETMCQNYLDLYTEILEGTSASAK